MSYANRIVALMAGIALLPVCGYVSDFVDEMQWSTNYYKFFVSQLSGLRFGLPCFVLSLAWSWITLRWLARPPRVAVWWCLGGLIGGFICLDFYSAVRWHYFCTDFVRQNPSAHWECSALTSVYKDLIWTGPIFLSILSGLAAAAAIILKSKRITAHASYA